MKNYRQLIKELPSKSVTVTFSGFNVPSLRHESLIRSVKKLSEAKGTDYIVYSLNDSKNLLEDRKAHYLNLLFPNTHFVETSNSIKTVVESLTKKYKHITIVVGENKVEDTRKSLKEFANLSVVSYGDKDPDAEATKLKSIVTKGNYSLFKESLPSNTRDIDGKLLMNELRQGMGLEGIKEQVKFTVDQLREKYFKGEIYHIGEVVESNGVEYEIMDRGSNYLTLIDESGEMCKKWINDVTIVENKNGLWANIHAKRNRIKRGSGERMRKPGSKGAPTDQALKDSQVKEDIQPGYAPEEISFKGYTTKNLHHSGDAAKAFQQTIQRYGQHDPVAVLNALKATDAYMQLNDLHLEQGKAPDPSEVKSWVEAHTKARESLQRIGEFNHHEDYWHMHEHELQGLVMDYTPQSAGADMAESIDSRVTVDKKSGYNAAKDVMRYTDFKKLLKMNKGQVSEAQLVKKPMEQDDDDMDPYDSDDKAAPIPPDEKGLDTGVAPAAVGIAMKDLENKGPVSSEVGHSFGHGQDSQMRRRKVEYTREEVSYKKFLQIQESILNPKDPHGDYKEKSKALHQLSLNKDVDQKEVTQRKLDLDKEYSKHTVKEDVATAEYTIKKFVGSDGETHERKIRPRRVTFAASKGNAEPAQTKQQDEAVSNSEKEVYNADHDLKKKKLKKEYPIKADPVGGGNQNQGFDAFFREEAEEISDEELDKLVDTIHDVDDIIDVYSDDELAVIDTDTGEEVESDLKEDLLNEVLSRMERIKAKIRFARTKSIRERKISIALKRHSSTKTINSRARKLAVALIKKRIAKKPLNKLSTSEKERIETIIAKRKNLVNRLAMKLVARVRKVENERLAHHKFTKE